MKNGIIKIDTNRGKEFNFTSDKYSGYLWKTNNYIYISFIESKKRGNFKKLVDNILNKNYGIKIPTPLGRMQEIVIKNKYKFTVEENGYEVWILNPRNIH